MNKFHILLASLIFLACKEQKVTNTTNEAVFEKKAITPKTTFSILGNYSKPLANNINSDLALSDTGGDKLFIYSDIAIKTPSLITNTQNVGNNFAWSKDGTSIIFKEKTKDYQTQIISLNTKTLKRQELKNLPKHTAIKALSISDTIYYLNAKTLAVSAQFQNKKWTISSEKGNYYNIEVSPNNKYLIAHKGSYIYLFTTSGTFLKKLGKGIATNWHQNSKQIIGFLDSSEDGHSITGSELYLFHIEEQPVKISASENEIETWPSFKNNTEIVYRDEKRNGVFSKNISQYIK